MNSKKNVTHIEKTHKFRKFLFRLRKSIPLYILLLPSVLILIFFTYKPMYGIIIAFKDYSPALGIKDSEWVGFDHFIRYFNSYQFDRTIINTLRISLYGMLVGFPLPIMMAILCNQMLNQRFKRTYQVITYLPHFISVVVMCGIIIIFLSPSSSVFSHILALFGVEMKNLMTSADAFSHIYVWSDIWQHVGWNSIIYLAALSTIDPNLYEAAAIDGASRWQMITNIDIPLILPTAAVMLILQAGGILNVGWEKILLLQNASNILKSEVISTYVYKIGMQSFQYSLSTAIGLFNTIINLIVLIIVNTIVGKLSGVGIFSFTED